MMFTYFIQFFLAFSCAKSCCWSSFSSPALIRLPSLQCLDVLKRLNIWIRCNGFAKLSRTVNLQQHKWVPLKSATDWVYYLWFNHILWKRNVGCFCIIYTLDDNDHPDLWIQTDDGYPLTITENIVSLTASGMMRYITEHVFCIKCG